MEKGYVDLSYSPKRGEIIAEYYLEPSKGNSYEEVASAVAGESSIDTWTDIKTLNAKVSRKLKPHVFQINGRIMRIAYNPALFELGSVAQLLSSLAGNILSMKLLRNIRLLDICFPKQFVESFQGPRFGISGVRKICKVKKRPLLGTIVKPKTGLSPKEHALVAYNSWVGGVDLVKDDENLTNQGFNPFKERVNSVLKLRARAERETGHKKIYMPNITAPTTQELLRRAKYVKSLNGEYAMVDIITSGWTALQSLREENNKLGLVLHGHRCGHSAFTRNEKHGISMLVVAKLTRLIGLDQLHIGTIIGKMAGNRDEVLDISHEMEHSDVPSVHDVLRQRWYSIKPLMPVASGGLQPLMIPKLLKYFGYDIILQFGGGIHAHPMGTRAGARAAFQALEATLKNIPLPRYAKGHEELSAALRKWG